MDWLDYNGYTMVTKPTKEFVDSFGRRKIKGNMDIELSVDAMRLADSLDHIVLFTGDGDFRALVAALQMKGKRVTVVSTLQTQPPMVADELRRQADQFVDLADMESMISRDAAGRPPRDPAAVDRPERPDRPERLERPERPERPERSERPERRDAPVRTTRPRGPRDAGVRVGIGFPRRRKQVTRE